MVHAGTMCIFVSAAFKCHHPMLGALTHFVLGNGSVSQSPFNVLQFGFLLDLEFTHCLLRQSIPLFFTKVFSWNFASLHLPVGCLLVWTLKDD